MTRLFATAFALLSVCPPVSAYSVLTHQAIIDTVWKASLEPALRNRFPGLSDDAVLKARAHSYGGCIIQDMGYYPFGSKFFSDLTHYVRSGDFVMRLIADAKDPDEYAFALGTLAHYVSDTQGHPLAINRAVAVEYPDLAARFGTVITYAQNPTAHIKTEFGFDVLQVARGRYASESYHDFIGFEVSKDLLERSFLATYSLELKDVFASVDLALGSYRWAVSRLIPQASKVAWELRKDELLKDNPSLTRRKFIYNLSRADYEHTWGRTYARPGIATRILAFFMRFIPHVGPFKAIEFRPPTAQTSTLFMNSFNRTVSVYEKLLTDVGQHSLHLENLDFDTGKPTAPGEYRLADATYSQLAQKLAASHPENLSPDLRGNIMQFFANPKAPNDTRRHRKEWKKTQAALRKLEPHPTPSPASH